MRQPTHLQYSLYAYFKYLFTDTNNINAWIQAMVLLQANLFFVLNHSTSH